MMVQHKPGLATYCVQELCKDLKIGFAENSRQPSGLHSFGTLTITMSLSIAKVIAHIRLLLLGLILVKGGLVFQDGLELSMNPGGVNPLDTVLIQMLGLGVMVACYGLLGLWQRTGKHLVLRTEITDLRDRELALQQRQCELCERDVLLLAMQQASPDGFAAIATDGRIIAYNQRMVEMWDIPPEILATRHRKPVGAYMDSLVEEPVTLRQEIEQAYADPTLQYQRENRLKDGRIFHSYTAPLPDLEGQGSGRVWFHRDITHLRRLERETCQREERLQAAIDVLGDGFGLFDAEDRLVRCNQAFADLYQQTPEALQGIDHETLLRDAHRRGVGLDTGGLPFEAWLAELHRTRRQQPHRQLELRGHDGRWFLVNERLTASGELVLVRTDITRQKQQEEELRRLATTDSLTGALNHRHFMQQATAEVHRAHRYNHSLTLLMLDADHFKQINDVHGHAAGDQVLREIVNTLRQELRENDLLGRLGGEEFAVVLPETDMAPAVAVAERLRERLASLRFQGPDRAFGITVSIGLATRLPNEETLESLLRRVDQALYRAKDAGRDQVILA